MSNVIIDLKNIDITFTQKRRTIQAVKDVSIQIEKGDIYGIVGYSGAGKSTLVRAINLLQVPTAGKITIGEDVTFEDGKVQLTTKELRQKRQTIGMIFQHFNLMAQKTAYENVAFALKVIGASTAVIKKKVPQMLSMVGLAAKYKSKPRELSGGEQQRVAIARALVNEPKVLLLDEPLGALDAKIRKQMQIELKKIQREVGITFIYVTHDQEEALSMSDTVVVMNNGEIQQIGSPTDIYNEPENRFVAGFIGESNIIEGTMIKDFLVEFDGFQFECVDKGFEDNEAIEVVLRPEDLDIVEPDQAKIRGTVRNITFKGVHYEILIETELRTYMVHTTDYAEVGREVGLKFGPEDIHVMCRMGGY